MLIPALREVTKEAEGGALGVGSVLGVREEHKDGAGSGVRRAVGLMDTLEEVEGREGVGRAVEEGEGSVEGDRVGQGEAQGVGQGEALSVEAGEGERVTV